MRGECDGCRWRRSDSDVAGTLTAWRGRVDRGVARGPSGRYLGPCYTPNVKGRNQSMGLQHHHNRRLSVKQLSCSLMITLIIVN